MPKKPPNSNLWSAQYTTDMDPEPRSESALLICAPSAGSAEKKAVSVLKKLGCKKIRIVRLKHEGTIDAF